MHLCHTFARLVNGLTLVCDMNVAVFFSDTSAFLNDDHVPIYGSYVLTVLKNLILFSFYILCYFIMTHLILQLLPLPNSLVKLPGLSACLCCRVARRR